MIEDERYRSFIDTVGYDFFVKIYDPLRRKLRGEPAAGDSSTLFVHLPKNAGSSLFAALGVRNVGHRLFCDIPENEKRRAERIVFCTRDPFDRIVSAYRYQQGLVERKGRRRGSLIGDLGEFAEFVLSPKLERLSAHHYFFRSQFRYLQGIERYAERLVHLRFAHLAGDARAKLGLEVGRLNAAETPLCTADDAALRERVRSVYRDDYEALPVLLRECGIELSWDS